MKQVLPEWIRQTYILLYEKDNVRYIFNRSVKWNDIMKTKNIEKIINILGKDAINNFTAIMNEKLKNDTKNDVIDFTKTFVYDDTVFYIIEVHPEWENYNRSNQTMIDKRKKELCLEYNAVDRIDKIEGDVAIELQISNIIKKEFKKWLVDIYSAISEYSHLIYDETVKTTLWLTKESLLNEINQLQHEKNNLDKIILQNKEKLRRQNYMIAKLNKYIEDNFINQINYE